ncbi:MAG: cobyrinate a,c-diamide synthase [Treponema sp.]|jgi:cobyrinic acid a,c-diamide synthase|nr:cobyrinate a,c-diamide synthase [Treponema sp.]
MTKYPRVCIAAGWSGAGKTTFSCGLLKALIGRGIRPAAFKCGPDFIDPMFHREVLGAHSSNLDLFLLDETAAKTLVRENMDGKDMAVMEGVMGFYDGIGGAAARASTWHIASVTKTPVILVEDCAASGMTAVSRIKGMTAFREPSMIAGAVINNCGETLFRDLKSAIENETFLKVYGFLPRMKEYRIESRHLGLVTAAEIEDLREIIAGIAARIESTVDVEGIIELGNRAPGIDLEETGIGNCAGENSPPSLCGGVCGAKSGTKAESCCRVAIARDKVFCFYYEDALNQLRRTGAELVFFSPLYDRRLPADIKGLYFGGGYPELYAETLSENTEMLRNIRAAVERGTPTIAECGGFMYLHEELMDKTGASYKMCGVLPGTCRPSPGLVHFGYAEYTALADNLLCRAGESLRGHEFHYWVSDNPGGSFRAKKPRGDGEWSSIIATDTLFAGFPHFHWYAYPGMLERFLRSCENHG